MLLRGDFAGGFVPSLQLASPAARAWLQDLRASSSPPPTLLLGERHFQDSRGSRRSGIRYGRTPCHCRPGGSAKSGSRQMKERCSLVLLDAPCHFLKMAATTQLRPSTLVPRAAGRARPITRAVVVRASLTAVANLQVCGGSLQPGGKARRLACASASLAPGTGNLTASPAC